MAYNQFAQNPYPNFRNFGNPNMHVTMSEPQEDQVDRVLRGISPMYVYYQRVLGEVKQTMQKYGFGFTIRKNQRNLDQVTLRGKIQTAYKGSFMDITLLIMFPYEYPFARPMCFVEPENDKELVPHHGIVFPDYSINHYMLRSWNSNENIPGLIDILKRDFAGNSPLRPKQQYSLYPNQHTVPSPYPQMIPNHNQNAMCYSSPNPQMHSNPYQPQPQQLNNPYPDLSQRSKPLPSIPQRSPNKSPNQLHIQQDIQHQQRPFNCMPNQPNQMYQQGQFNQMNTMMPMNPTYSQQSVHNGHPTHSYSSVPYEPKAKPLPPLPNQHNQHSQMTQMNQTIQINQNSQNNQRPKEMEFQQIPIQQIEQTPTGQRSIGNTTTSSTEMKKSLPSVSSLTEIIDVSAMELEDPEDVQKHGGLPALQIEKPSQIEGFAPFKSDDKQTTILNFPQLTSLTSDLKSMVLGFFDQSRKSPESSNQPLNPHNK